MESAQSAINVKAYLEKPGQSQPEIRRFNMEEGASTNFEYLTGKLKSIYPSLPEMSYGVYWKDDEGDLIAIGSDDELIQALLYGRPQGLLKLYLRSTGSTSTPRFGCGGDASDSSAEHPGVVCDGCEGPVRGIRFKCMVCPDFDLCGGCCDKGLHNHHYMLRMTQPATDWAGRSCGGPGRGGNRAGWWWPGYGGAGRHAGWNPRRFWKQFMRGQWQNGEPQSAGGCPSANQSEGAPAASSSAASGSAQQQAGTSSGGATASGAAGQSEEREFLEHVGHQMSALLEPFGIQVDVEERVNPRAQSQQTSSGGARGKCSRNGKCKPDPQCKKSCGETGPSVIGEGEKTQSEAATGNSVGAAANTEEVPPAAEDPEKTREEADMDSDESSWIKVEPKADDMDVIVLEPPATEPAVKPSAPPPTDSSSQATTSVPLTRLYPSLTTAPSARPKSSPPPPTQRPASTSQTNPSGPSAGQSCHQPITDLDEKVFQAVNQMKAMGFHDEGGWMTAMLYQNNGEIYRVIDNVLKAAQNKRN